MFTFFLNMERGIRIYKPKSNGLILKRFFNPNSSNSKPLKNIPSAQKWPIFHTLYAMKKSNFGTQLHKYIDEMHLKLGPIFRETLGPVSAVFISDPHEMKRVFANEGKYPVHVLPEAWLLYNQIYKFERGLYFMNGEEWLEHRKLLNSLFLKNFPKYNFLRWSESSVDKLLSDWYVSSHNGEVLHLDLKLYILSVHYMTALMVGSSFQEHLPKFDFLITALASRVQDIFKESVNLSQFPVKLMVKFQLPAWKRFAQVVTDSLDIATELFNVALSVAHPDGLISQLKLHKMPLKNMSRILMDFILAAGDTTATATLWALYLLAGTEEIQSEVANELHGDLVETCESESLRAILRETLRLYPVAPFLTRFLPEEITVFNSYKIPANEMIVLSMYTSSRCEKFFPEPNEFRPSRWKRTGHAEYPGVKDPFATLPYAIGARSCIGRKIAQSQICFILAKIIQKYELFLLDSASMKLHLIPVPDKPIRILLKPRAK